MAPESPSKVEWTAWGERDPLWGAATWTGHGRGGPHAWTKDQFLESGHRDWGKFVAHWRAYGLDTSSCLEIARGAGRITNAMALTFDHVYAIDISPGMIAKAKEHIDADNVTFILTDGRTVPLEVGSVTAAFSSQAFHHFESVEDGARYFEVLSRVLVPSGTLMVNLDIHQFPSPNLFGLRHQFIRLQKLMYSTVLTLSGILVKIRRRRLRHGTGNQDLFFRLISYEIEWTFSTLNRLGFTDIELLVFPALQPSYESESEEISSRLRAYVFANKHGT